MSETLTSKEIHETVLHKLDGLEARNQMRKVARELMLRLRKVYAARHNGKLDKLTSAQAYLQEIGASYVSEDMYGLTVLHVSCGAMLVVLPTGELNWCSGARMKKPQGPAVEQGEIFSPEETGAEYDPFGFFEES